MLKEVTEPDSFGVEEAVEEEVHWTEEVAGTNLAGSGVEVVAVEVVHWVVVWEF